MSEDWRTRAICVGADPDLSFRKPDAAEVQAFIATFCRAPCPVIVDCLKFGRRVESGMGPGAERYGVYGGLTGPERGRLERFGARLCSRCRRSFVPVREASVRCQGCARPAVANPSPVSEHGTRAGAERHRRRGEEPCHRCREAKNRYDRWWREQHRGVA